MNNRETRAKRPHFFARSKRNRWLDEKSIALCSLLVAVSMVVYSHHSIYLRTSSIRPKTFENDQKPPVDPHLKQSFGLDNTDKRTGQPAANDEKLVDSMNERFPFQGVYMCHEPTEAYGAAWLTSKEKFLRVSNHNYKQAMSYDLNWSLLNVSWGDINNLAEGSWLLLVPALGAWKTVDAFEFGVEHLSGYPKFLNHNQKLRTQDDRKTQVILRIMNRRVEGLRRNWTLGKYANESNERTLGRESDGGRRDSSIPLGERVLAVIPFHAGTNSSLFGRHQAGRTGSSYTDTRRIFFEATLYSVSQVFPKIAVFVENRQDFEYCKELNATRIPLWEINFLENMIPDNRYLPEATVHETERRMRRGQYEDFDFVFFTEADQILRLRPHQLGDLLRVSSQKDDNAVLSPHRFAAIPHPNDFAKPKNPKQKYWMIPDWPYFDKKKFEAVGSKPVRKVFNVGGNSMMTMERCCHDLGDCKTKDDWVPLTDEDGTEQYFPSHPNATELPWKHRPGIELLQMGDEHGYHIVNGDPNNAQFEWRTCSLESGRECQTNKH